MLLTIDVGNTQTVLGLFEGDEVIEHWRINTDPRRTADEIAVVLQGLVQQSPLLAETDISGIALCSTVPSVLHEMREMCRRYYGDVQAVIVEPGVKTGVPVRMDNPKRGRRRPHRERARRRPHSWRACDRGRLRHRDHVRRRVR